jgi:aryl-alcohol dehydrogenase-like predicted oxidoreductase
MELRPRPGRGDLDDRFIDRLLNQVVDSGINFIDTSPDYGPSEDHIGRAIGHRRDEYLLASKCGCVVDPAAAGRFEHRYDRATIRYAVERSLVRLRTDHLDLVQFHMSPTVAILAEHDSIAELRALQQEGKVRFIGMSATLPNVNEHIQRGDFDAYQIPYSAVEHEHEAVIARAAHEGAGTIIRGGVAKGLPEPPPPSTAQPAGYRDSFVKRKERFSGAAIDDLLDDDTPAQFLLRFTLSHPDVHTVIVGTANPNHLEANLAAAARGPLPDDVYSLAKQRFAYP